MTPNRLIQRSAGRHFPLRAAGLAARSRRSASFKRRAVLGLLLLSCLVLVMASSRSNALGGVQGGAASILRPAEVAVQRVTRPFQDAIDWMGGLFAAQSENAKLEARNAALLRQLVIAQAALQQQSRTQDAGHFRGPPALADFTRIDALVLVPVQNPTDQSVVISAGSTANVHVNDVVVSPNDDLVGTVSVAYANESSVRLLTDARSGVTAIDVRHPAAIGIITGAAAATDSLNLDDVSESQPVQAGDAIVTAGSFGHGKLPSLYPRGLSIGLVQSATNSDSAAFKQIPVRPMQNLSSLWRISVLVPKTR
jgi:rod shape-determining protein MreC